MAEEVKYDQLKYDYRMAENPDLAIADYIRECKADLLVMFEKSNESLIDKLFHYDIVKQFATHTSLPLLSYNKLALDMVEV